MTKLKTRYYKAESKLVERYDPFGVSAPFRPGLPCLDDILHALRDGSGTQGAFDKLVKLDVDKEDLFDLLRTIGVSSDKPVRWAIDKRPLEQMTRKCEEIAAEISWANTQWPPFGQVMWWDYLKWLELPRTLRRYAKSWNKRFEHTGQACRSGRSPRNESVICLLRYVKNKTGDYHYPEVADLLNATDAAYGWETLNEEPRWTETNLSSVIKRKNAGGLSSQRMMEKRARLRRDAMRVLGADPGLAGATGCFVIECSEKGVRMLRFKALNLPPGASFEARLREVYSTISQLEEEFEPAATLVDPFVVAINQSV